MRYLLFFYSRASRSITPASSSLVGPSMVRVKPLRQLIKYMIPFYWALNLSDLEESVFVPLTFIPLGLLDWLVSCSYAWA